MRFESCSTKLTQYTTIDGVHRIFETSNREILARINSSLLEQLSSYFNKPLQRLDALHHNIKYDKINAARIHLFNYLNSGQFIWPDIVKALCADHLSHMIGPDYLLQKKVNLSIQMPNDASSTLAMHSDCISGDSPWQMNVWIPLTEASGTSSMYLVSMSESISVLDKLMKLEGLSKKSITAYREATNIMQSCNKTFISAQPGKILIFHPGALHGNEINTTDTTRFSLNIRVKSLFTPDSNSDHPDRGAGSYYGLGNQSEQCQFSQKLEQYFK